MWCVYGKYLVGRFQYIKNAKLGELQNDLVRQRWKNYDPPNVTELYFQQVQAASLIKDVINIHSL